MTIDEIKELQQTLNISVTGEYDPFTEAAVRNYQLKNGIPASGVVDNATKEKLIPTTNSGLTSTDLSENRTIKRLMLKSDEYFKGPTPKRSVFLHFTAGWDNPYRVVQDWENDARDKIATQFVIGGQHGQTLADQYDGEIVQCLPDYGCYGWHLGIGNTELHRTSIGIEICSLGPLKSSQGDYLMWAGKKVRPEVVVDLKRDFRGYRYFQKITDEQLKSTKFLLEKIAKETGIDIRKGLQQYIKTEKDVFKAFDYREAVKTKNMGGLFCHTHVSPPNRWNNFEKFDIQPQQEVIDMILSL